MKNVLFTTTALVAFSGAAFAAGHEDGPAVSFSGAVTVGYNDVVEGGIFWDADLDMSASVDMGGNVVATLSAQIADGDETAGGTFNFTPTIEIAYTGSPVNASLKVGDLGDKGASEYWYADRSGMAVDVENHDGSTDVRALVEFGSFGVALGCGLNGTNSCQGMNIGLGATFGSISVGVGYDDANAAVPAVVGPPAIAAIPEQYATTAVSVDATFGAIEIGVSYATGTSSYDVKTGHDTDDADDTVTTTDTNVTGTENSIGVELGYEISDSLNVSAYYANNSVRGDNYGLSGTFTTGAIAITAYYDLESTLGTPTGVDADGDGYFTGGQTTTGTSSVASYGADVAYTFNDQITVNAGVFLPGAGADMSYYVGMDYAINDSVSATVSYATANEISGPEYKNGITALISASF